MFFNAWLAQANLITKTDFNARLSSLNKKITSNKSKRLLIENELKKLKTFDSSYFISKSYFEKNDTQNYPAFKPKYRYFKPFNGVGNGNSFYYWQSQRLSDEKINSVKMPNHNITHYGTKTRVEFNGSCLRQSSVTFSNKK